GSAGGGNRGGGSSSPVSGRKTLVGIGIEPAITGSCHVRPSSHERSTRSSASPESPSTRAKTTSKVPFGSTRSRGAKSRANRPGLLMTTGADQVAPPSVVRENDKVYSIVAGISLKNLAQTM